MERQKKKKAFVIAGILFVLLLLTTGYAVRKGLAFKSVPLNLTDEELGIKPEPTEEPLEMKETPLYTLEKEEVEGDIINVALFGLDRRSPDEKNSRSDSIMIATLDFKHNKIKMTSLLRDQVVNIHNRGEDKLNHAYSYGGPELAIRTMNENFGTDIRDHVTVDFFTFQKIVDVLGGVDLQVSDKEIPYINKYTAEIARLENKSYKNYQSGERLNGQQALAYSRIRSVGNGDFERTERQRKVLAALSENVNDKNIVQLTSAWGEIAPYVETSFTRMEVLDIAQMFVTNRKMTTEEMRFPLDHTWSGKTLSNGMWVMEVDREKQRKMIQSYLYEDVSPF